MRSGIRTSLHSAAGLRLAFSRALDFSRALAVSCALAFSCALASRSFGQSTPPPAATPRPEPAPINGPVTPATAPSASASDDALVSLTFPDNVELKTLIDYVSKRLDINIVYQDDQVANQRLTIRSPQKLPVSALPALLEGLLRGRGLSLVEGDRPGWKRIVPLASAALPSTQPDAGPRPDTRPADPNRPLTQVFSLRYADPQRIDTLLKPFLSTPSASSFAVPEQHLELVTDYASNMARVGQLIRLLDQPSRGAQIEFVPVRNADSGQLALQVKQILTSRSRALALPGQAAESVDVTQDRRTNQLVLIGSEDAVAQAAKIVASLDVPVTEQQSPIRFYKLANATASDVLDTIRSLEEGSTSPAPRPPARASRGADAGALPIAGRPGSTALSPRAAPLRPGALGASPSGPSAQAGSLNGNAASGAAAPPPTYHAGGPINVPQPIAAPDESSSPLQSTAASDDSGANAPIANPSALRSGNASVTADTNTNTIIVVADPAVQRLYEQLIRQLDKRRPQVLVECTIVTIDTSHGFSLGVELGAHGKPGAENQVVTFNSFGLSTPDPANGQLALIPGTGFNGAIVNSDLAEVIIHALDGNTHSRITSAPRVLVNDNATGSLTSQAAFPTTATNIANTIATTSFGEYAEAGTSIILTPHISESDYLQLDYSVTLSSFTGAADTARGIPPPKQEDTVTSRVTIPDGSTVIVGGLNRTNVTKAINAVPGLGDVPVLKYLFSSRQNNDENVTLFVFLRPIILRDDQFEDLKFLSARDVKAAGVPAGWPTSKPLPIR